MPACYLVLKPPMVRGTPPNAGAFHVIPFVSSDLDSAQGLIESNVLGLGRDPTAPFQDVINVDGDVVVPVDLRNIGLWLKAMFAAPTTTGDDPYINIIYNPMREPIPLL